ncbi:MAG: hypothetical protein WED00_06540 [Aquisalimonadaceae bacterium]
MPFFRGAQTGWGRAGKNRCTEVAGVVANNDLSTLRRANEKVSGESHATGWSWLQDDYLVYGWKPCYRLINATGMILAALAFAFSVGGLIGTMLISWHYVLIIAVGAIAAYYYIYRAGFPRFVVFDRARGLVHVPRLFSTAQDAVRWRDANVCIIDEQSGSLGVVSSTALYIVRPGWDFKRDGYPPLRTRIQIDRVGNRLHEGHSEAVWRFIVAFMTLPRNANPYLRIVEDRLREVRDLNFGGDWDAMRHDRRSRKRYHGAFSHLNLASLSGSPDWLRKSDGSWRLPTAEEQFRRS